MKKLLTTLFLSSVFIGAALAQNNTLSGQYIFEVKGMVYTSYVFTGDHFVYFHTESSEPSIYGEGQFTFNNGTLTLQYDSAGLTKHVAKGYQVVPTKKETLKISNMKNNKFEIKDKTGYADTYVLNNYNAKKK